MKIKKKSLCRNGFLTSLFLVLLVLLELLASRSPHQSGNGHDIISTVKWGAIFLQAITIPRDQGEGRSPGLHERTAGREHHARNREIKGGIYLRKFSRKGEQQDGQRTGQRDGERLPSAVAGKSWVQYPEALPLPQPGTPRQQPIHEL